MKKIKITTIMLCFCIVKTYAQCASNGTQTDPSINANTGTPWATPTQANPSPNYPWSGFQTNTFDWTPSLWSNYVVDHSLGSLVGPITVQNPFYSSTLNYPFSAGVTSDFKSTSGWELIKQDMGWFYDASASPAWQGNPMGALKPGDPRLNGSQINYLMLYNKYTNTLRIMGHIPNFTGENTIYIKMRFLTTADYNSADSYKPNVSALFNVYNPVCKALDKHTTVTEISAASIFPSSGEMFYADFQLAYDPCTCLFQSGFEVHFASIHTASLQLSGTYAGTTNIPIANVTNYSGLAQGGSNFISSVFESGGSPQSAILSYNNADNIYSYDVGMQQDLKNGADQIDLFSSALGIVKDAPVVSNIFGFFTKWLNYMSTQLEPSDQIKANVAIKLESGYLQATGTIVDEEVKYAGINFRCGVPGSKDAGTLPEYAPTNSYSDVLPNYPMYNEVPGLFALLKTPTVNRYIQKPSPSNYGEINYARQNDYGISPPPPNVSGSLPGHGSGDYGYYNCQFYFGNPAYPQTPCSRGVNFCSDLTERDFPPATPDFYTVQYNPAADLVYSLSPLVDVSKSTIYVSYEIDGMPSNSTTRGTYVYKNAIGYEASIGQIDHFYRKITPKYPIGCNTGIFTQEQFGYVQNYIAGNIQNPNSYCPSYNTQTQCGGYKITDINNLFLNNPELALENFIPNVRLVVQLDLVSLPDQYGNVHRTAQIMKFDCDVNTTTTGGFGAAATAAIAAQTNTSNNLLLHATTYTAPKDIFSYGYITIDGNQIDNAPSNGIVNISAEIGTDLINNATLQGNINLNTQLLPNYFASCSGVNVPPVAGTYLTDYCQNSGNYAAGNGYKANSRTTASAASNKGNPPQQPKKSEMSISKLGTDIKLGIFPNPTSGVVYLNLSAQNAGGLFVNVSTLDGAQVMHNSFTANEGANNFRVDLSGLSQGVYFINITDENGTTIKNDKIILLGQ